MKISLLGILSESDQTSINEVGAKQFVAGFTGDAKAFKSAKPGIFAAFSDVLAFAKQDKNQIVGLTAKSPNKAVVITNVDDLLHALRVEGGMASDVLAKFNQGLLKSSKTPIDLIDGITKEVVGSKNFVSRYGKLTDSEMRKALKAAGYSDNAIDSLMKNAKKNPTFKKSFDKGVALRKAKKTAGGKTKNLSPKGSNTSVPPTQKKTLLEKSKELINNINVKKMTWKQLLAWGAGIGVGALAIWWFLFDNDVVIPDDTPETEPTDAGGEWLECVKELVNNKEGVVKTTSNGATVVVVKNEQYPKGIQFYTNGRVMDLSDSKMGSWKCKGGKATISEQASDAVMAQDVDKMIDYLDFPVTYSDLKNAGTLLQNYANKGKGKEFLNLYQQSGLGGGDLGKSLKYIITTEPESVQAKANLSTIYNNILSGKSTATSTTPATKIGLGHIEITWDGAKKSEGGGGGDGSKPKRRKSSFKDCNGKALPHEFGCRSEQIKKLQGCLGIEPQLGNFGPKTKKALEALNIDTTNGITQDIIDKVCNDKNVQRKLEKIEPINTLRKIDTTLKTPDIKLKTPSIKSIYDAGKKVYDDATSSGALFERGGRLKYKGDYLSQTDLDELNRYLSALGWKFMKEKDKEDYDVKYVWVKK